MSGEAGKMHVRSSSDKQRRSLKMAFARLIDLIGPGNVVATLTRVNAPMLSLYSAPHEVDRQAAIDVVLDLELAAGEPVVTRTLAAFQGYELVKTGPTPAGAVLPVDIADLEWLHREAAQAVSAVMTGLADHLLTPGERERILKELGDLRTAISAIEHKVEAA